MSKLIPYVPDVELTAADNKPIHHPVKNDKGEVIPGPRATLSELDFLCELTASPGFAKKLKAWAAADLQFATRTMLNEQAPMARAQGGYLVTDEMGHALIEALDELDPSAEQKEVLFNLVPFGRAVKAQTTPEEAKSEKSATNGAAIASA